MSATQYNFLLDPQQLANRQSDFVIFDCRFDLANPEAGFDAYKISHIPGAVYAHLDKNLSSPKTPKTGRHPLPNEADFVTFLSESGLSSGKPAVVYDKVSGPFAARMFWLLRYYGHNEVYFLDGGITAWEKEGLSLTPEIQEVTKGRFIPDLDASMIKTADDLKEITDGNHGSKILVDAREEKRFRGEIEPLDPVAGHIPGAVCHPFGLNLDQTGKFLPKKNLQELWLKTGATSDKTVILYCGSGVTACHNYMAACLAGFAKPIVYPGSWSEWITDPSRPVAN